MKQRPRLTLDSGSRALPTRSYVERFRAPLAPEGYPGIPEGPVLPAAAWEARPCARPARLLREPPGPRCLVPITADNRPSAPEQARSLSVNPDIINTPSIVWPSGLVRPPSGIRPWQRSKCDRLEPCSGRGGLAGGSSALCPVGWAWACGERGASGPGVLAARCQAHGTPRSRWTGAPLLRACVHVCKMG